MSSRLNDASPWSARAQQSPAAESVDCPHRGGKIRQQVADLCGLRGQPFPVYGCQLHGECTDRLICQRQTVRTCFICRANGEDQVPAGTS
jgi:hypothetical protein